MAEPFLCNGPFCRLLASLVQARYTHSGDPDQLEIFNTCWDPFSGHVLDVQTVAQRQSGACVACGFIVDYLQASYGRLTNSETYVYVSARRKRSDIEVGWSDELVDNDNLKRSKYAFAMYFLANSAEPDIDGLRMLNLKQYDYNQVQRWIKHCEDHHQEHCGSSYSWADKVKTESDRLRVYDIQLQCLAMIDWTSERYVSLSYVWGSASPPRLTKAQESAWTQAGALKAHVENFPQAIRDALEVAKGLGCRYFWFDSLCLVQDDPDELVKGIDNMHLIYQRAYITIIAAHAPDANSGFPGVSTAREPQTWRNIGNELSLAIPQSRHVTKWNSKWGTRCWTLQEQILSRRTLTITPGQMSYQCFQSHFFEDESSSVGSKDRRQINSFINFGKNLEHHLQKPSERAKILKTILGLVNEYSLRDLSFDTDTLRAITGLFQQIVLATGIRTLQGLPTTILPAALAFTLEGRQSGKPRRKPGFPSYSWAGWEATADWTHLDGPILDLDYQSTEQWLQEANWIVWMVLEKQQECWKPAKIQDQIPGLGTAFPRELLQRSGCSDTEFTMNIWSEGDAILADTSWITYPCLLFSTLIFRTKIVYAGETDDNDPYEDFESWNVEDQSGNNACGVVVLDDPSHTSETRVVDCLVISERWTFSFEEGAGPQGRPTWNLQQGRHVNDAGTGNDDAHSDEAAAENRRFHVLVVEEVRSGGVYERRGVGWVSSSAITCSLQPGVAWKRIVLA